MAPRSYYQAPLLIIQKPMTQQKNIFHCRMTLIFQCLDLLRYVLMWPSASCVIMPTFRYITTYSFSIVDLATNTYKEERGEGERLYLPSDRQPALQPAFLFSHLLIYYVCYRRIPLEPRPANSDCVELLDLLFINDQHGDKGSQSLASDETTPDKCTVDGILDPCIKDVPYPVTASTSCLYIFGRVVLIYVDMHNQFQLGVFKGELRYF